MRRVICFLAFLSSILGAAGAQAQEPAGKQEEKASQERPAQGPAESGKPELPFQIQLLETHIRFEENGDSRKEVHTIVKINNALGAHEFARISFDYNRSFQQVEIPLVRISHANGGTSEVLPSAVSDAPNPAVEQFPAYLDVRVKSVRILGLQEGDTLEYRVITTTTKHPLAPDFWLEHTFDRSGQIVQEIYDLNLPASRFEEADADKAARLEELNRLPQWQKEFPADPYPARIGRIYVSPERTEVLKERVGEGDSIRLHYKWEISSDEAGKANANVASGESGGPDIVVTSYFGWEATAWAFQKLCYTGKRSMDEPLSRKREEIVNSKGGDSMTEQEALYDFVSRKIKTVELPLALAGFKARAPSETLATDYGTAADKAALLIALIAQTFRPQASAQCAMVPNSSNWQMLQLPRPSVFSQLLVRVSRRGQWIYTDPGLEVAPFGLVRADLRGRDAFAFYYPPFPIIRGPEDYYSWTKIPSDLPFQASQIVKVDASVSAKGDLSAKVKYTMRGDNELLLRVAFHKTPKEHWKDVANLLALSDGFRGQVTSVNASDPMETKDPFTVEYELTQARFVDWAKKPVRIPALLPQIGLPDAGPAGPRIELGTPLDVQTSMTLRLPAGTKVQMPPGTNVERDYAIFSSKYSATQNTATASRHIRFLKREIPGDRGADYNTFVRAVQNDQGQLFVLAGK